MFKKSVCFSTTFAENTISTTNDNNNNIYGSASSSHITAICDARAVDAQLLYNSSEHAANSLLKRSSFYITASRICSFAVVLSAGVTGVLAFWQHRRIYRVWRLRNPRRVAQYRVFMWTLAASCVVMSLYLISPLGFIALYEAKKNDVRRLDVIAVRALVLGRRYQSLIKTSAPLPDAHVMMEFDQCEEEWAALMKERIKIDENV